MPDANLLVHPEHSVRLGLLSGVRVREDTLFTDHKGEVKTALRNRAEKAFATLGDVIYAAS